MWMNNSEIPSTIEVCRHESNTVREIKKWSMNSESVGLIGAIIICIGGFVGFIVMAGEDFEVALFGIALPVAVGAFVWYATMKAFSVLLGALAEIIHNTGVTANVSLYIAHHNGNTVVTESKPNVQPESKSYRFDEASPSVKIGNSGSEWKCAGCGKILPNYVGTCGCGGKKPR